MKERLIAFTRNQSNVKKVNIAHWIILFLILAMQVFIFKNPIIVSIVFIALIIDILGNYFIRGLSKENEDVIRNNDLASLFLQNPDVIFITIMLIMIIITNEVIRCLNKAGIYKIVISVPQFIIGCILFIIFVMLMNFVVSKISKYLRKMLIK